MEVGQMEAATIMLGCSKRTNNAAEGGGIGYFATASEERRREGHVAIFCAKNVILEIAENKAGRVDT